MMRGDMDAGFGCSIARTSFSPVSAAQSLFFLPGGKPPPSSLTAECEANAKLKGAKDKQVGISKS